MSDFSYNIRYRSQRYISHKGNCAFVERYVPSSHCHEDWNIGGSIHNISTQLSRERDQDSYHVLRELAICAKQKQIRLSELLKACQATKIPEEGGGAFAALGATGESRNRQNVREKEVTKFDLEDFAKKQLKSYRLAIADMQDFAYAKENLQEQGFSAEQYRSLQSHQNHICWS